MRAAAREPAAACLRSGLARPPLRALTAHCAITAELYHSPNGVSVIRTWQSDLRVAPRARVICPYIISLIPQCRSQPSLAAYLPTVDTRSPARVAAIKTLFMHLFPCLLSCMHPLRVLPRRSHASRVAPRARTSRCRIVYVPRPLTRLLGSMALQLLVA